MDMKERKRKLGALTRFEHAHDNYLFRGSMHPDDRPVMEHRYLLAKAHLLRVLGFEVKK